MPAFSSGLKVTELFGGAMSCLLPGSFEDISQYRPVPDHQEVFVDKDSNSSIMVEILAREDEVPSATAATYFFDDLAEFNKAEGKSVVLHLPPPAGLSDVAATSSEITVQKCCLIGRQDVPKDHKVDDVLTFLTAFRLSPIETDLLITMALGPELDTNIPVALSSTLAANPTVLFAGPDALTTGATGSGSDYKATTAVASSQSTDTSNNNTTGGGSDNVEKIVRDEETNAVGSLSSGKSESLSNRGTIAGLNSMEEAYSALTRSLQVLDWSLFG